MISSWGLSTAAMRSDSWRRSGSGSLRTDWNCTRRRRACWSSGGSQRRTVRSAGKDDRRRSTFLGFTHYCRTQRNGRFGLGRKPVAKRMRRSLQAIKAELRKRIAREPEGDGTVARAGAARVAWLLRGADERSVAVAVRLVPEAAVAARPPPEVAAGLLHLGAPERTVSGTLAPRHYPPSVAVGAICRQDSRREPCSSPP